MSKSSLSFVLAALLLTPTLSQADVVVIVHPSNKAAIDDDAITKLFLGQLKTFPGGAPAIPVDQKTPATAEEFHLKVLNKSDKEVRKVWARQVFTGGLQPPPNLDDDEAVVQYVATTPEAIGYVQAAKVTNKVKVVRK
ncbi:MAG: phosphate ABC transporter substrate-binding protein [Acidobacteriota bacterium]